MARLDSLALELDGCSKEMAEAESEIEAVEEDYRVFMDDYETGLWDAHENDDAKLPSEAMRVKLAHRAMNPELLGAYMRPMRKRKKLEKQIAHLKSAVSAQQSILSALKTEAEAAR